MKSALVISILVKGFGALFEIAAQVLITRFGSVALFGEYNFYVSVAEIICWLLFSGIVKLNAYYVANGQDISQFRRKFWLVFALPITILLSALGGLAYSALFAIVVAGSYCYGMQLNLSSVFLACGRYKVSLFGEYLVSRAVLLIGVVAMIAFGTLGVDQLVAIYILGFVTSVCFFIAKKQHFEIAVNPIKSEGYGEVLRKQVRFQLTDVANGLINQAPVIVQYLFSGAFQAGVLSVVLVTRKVISFIAGPTAKIYLPEFARSYGRGDLSGLRKTYREIVLLQMCFVLPICLVVIGAPESLLAIYNQQLVEYGLWMRAAAGVFMVMVLFGPQGNLLSMVGQERIEMWSKWLSLAVMVTVMALTFGDPMFVFYGIAAQVVADAAAKLIFLIRVLGGFPIGLADWFRLGLPFLTMTLVVAWLPFGAMLKLVLSGFFAVALCVTLVLLFFRHSIASRLGRAKLHG